MLERWFLHGTGTLHQHIKYLKHNPTLTYLLPEITHTRHNKWTTMYQKTQNRRIINQNQNPTNHSTGHWLDKNSQKNFLNHSKMHSWSKVIRNGHGKFSIIRHRADQNRTKIFYQKKNPNTIYSASLKNSLQIL